MITVQNLTYTIDNKKILKNLNFQAEDGKVLGIIGVSGSGKTTLLKCMTGITDVTEGTLLINGYTLDKNFRITNPERYWEFRKNVGIVFQHLYLFPHLTALGNVIEAPVQVNKVDKQTAIKEATALLTEVGLKDSINKYPDELSGGEQQRVAIVRSLIMKPSLLLLDEPTSALDPQRSLDIRTMLKNYTQQGHSLIIVSHSIKFLRNLADDIIFMDQGEIVESGPTEEILLHPKQQRTIEFLQHA
ncbi:MAG: ATP-binding cassette domain-containing protein [Ignavibacteria bacterium]|nr:ATP-binding cassette domain-containing protein [Ignavibacteria bacterium]